ncbi:hypothetical protein K3495_g1453 [Podosphaera aphanis]|nr:hypothetical protein K3495_g1453 [Podosphaera aphanis]
MNSTGEKNLDPEPVVRLVLNGKIVNRILASICAQESMSKFGVKAELQNRIIEKLYTHVANNDAIRFDRLKTMIEVPSVIPQTGQYVHVTAQGPSPPHVTSANMSKGSGPVSGDYVAPYNPLRGSYYFRSHGTQALQVRPSPYYTILEQVGPTVLCDVMTSHRYTAKIPFSTLQFPILSRLPNEPDLRIMIFGSPGGIAPQYITFPHQSELKVNGGEVKANLRGLKNKPGSTRPVDITDYIRCNPPSYLNNVEMTYALTYKKYYIMAAVVRSIPVPKLVETLAGGQKITQSFVVTEMQNKSRDSDIVATASVLSLKCPLSTIRIELPCRSTSCRHNQCFDASSYLQLQEQGPTWSCPICNKPAPFESLAVDEYVHNILQNTTKSVEQVTIQPDGKWELNEKKKTFLPKISGDSFDSGDEVIEINHSDSTCQNSLGPKTPKCSSMDKSQMMDHTSNKRPAAIVIDLTSSGDEEDESLSRPRKRQVTSYNYTNPSLAPPTYATQPASGEVTKS